ncbi:hypothetical protein ABZP36_004500 [Zizania latifolia]
MANSVVQVKPQMNRQLLLLSPSVTFGDHDCILKHVGETVQRKKGDSSMFVCVVVSIGRGSGTAEERYRVIFCYFIYCSSKKSQNIIGFLVIDSISSTLPLS